MSQAAQLISAARDGDIAIVKRLLTGRRVDVNVADENDQSPLYTASGHGHFDVVNTLIEIGANVNQATKGNETALYVASQEGHHDVVQSLVEAGADVNIARSYDGWSPLFTASFYGHLNIVKTIIGASVNQRTKDNETPLLVASHSGRLDVVQSLLGAGADVNVARSDNGWSPLGSASGGGHLAVVKTLIEAGAYVMQCDKNGWSPLYIASFNGHLDVVKTLIEAGASVNQTNKDGKTALDIAVEKGHCEIIQLLKTSQFKVPVTVLRQSPEERATRAEQQLIKTRQQNDALQQQIRLQNELADEKARRAEERATKAEQEILEKTKQNDALQQQIRLQNQQANALARKAEERASRAEQQYLETKQQSDALQQQFRLQNARTRGAEERATRAEEIATRAEERATRAEERATRAEQELLETKQQNDALQQQIRLQVQQADDRARRAEERATRTENELRLSRQQSEAQLRHHVTQVVPQHSDPMKSSWRVERDEIEVMEGKPLGVGGWGEVREAMFRGVKVAAKFLHEEIISPHNTDLFIREMNIAASVRHPNLLLFIGATLGGSKPVIITELMPVNLRSIISVLLRGHVISIGIDVACGLNYLHLVRPDPIIHRDVSSANILVERTELGGYRAKVSDYGSANFLSKVITMGPGNASYAAPESMNPRLQSPKMDVYSYGILLLEMATGQFPDQSVRAIQLDTLLWQEMKEIIRRCICEDPANRPTMKDILLLLP